MRHFRQLHRAELCAAAGGIGAPADSSAALRWRQRSHNRVANVPIFCSACSTPALASVFFVRPDRTVRAAVLWSGLVVDRLGGSDAAFAGHDRPWLWLAPLAANTAMDRTVVTEFAVAPVLDSSHRLTSSGAGYIAYMTFMIAYVRDGGGGVAAQSAFWSLIGISAFVTLGGGGVSGVRLWRPLHHDHSRYQRDRRWPCWIFGHSPLLLLAISALVFGVAFGGSGSTTAFVRFNYPAASWPTAIAAMTISFGIGQTIGPIVVGAITDAVGSLSFALNISAAMPACGAILSVFQSKLFDPIVGWAKARLRAVPTMILRTVDGGHASLCSRRILVQLPLNELYLWSSQ